MSAEMILEGPAKIAIKGEVLWRDHFDLEHVLSEATGDNSTDLVVDLRETTFIFSSALALMIAAGAKVLERGGRARFLIPPRLNWVANYLQQSGPGQKFEVEVS